MIYTDLYLKFESESQAQEILYTQHAAQLDDAGNIITEAHTTQNFQNTDIIGEIYNSDGVYDEAGEVVQAPTLIPGWHVNVRLTPDESSETLEPFRVSPTTPRRVWA